MKKNGFSIEEFVAAFVVMTVATLIIIPKVVDMLEMKDKIEMLKKGYNDISQATKLLKEDNENSLKGLFSDITQVQEIFSKYLNVSKKCTDNDIYGKCWSKENNFLNEKKASNQKATGFVLSDGSYLKFVSASIDCTSDNIGHLKEANGCAMAFFDVNGLKAPNKFGKDIFVLHFLKEGLFPGGAGISAYSNSCDPYSSNIMEQKGFGCASYYLKNEKNK